LAEKLNGLKHLTRIDLRIDQEWMDYNEHKSWVCKLRVKPNIAYIDWER
jgi:hypothetical protein